MAKTDFPKGSGKQSKFREKSVKTQGILKWILSGNPTFASLSMKALASLHVYTDLPKPSLIAYTNYDMH